MMPLRNTSMPCTLMSADALLQRLRGLPDTFSACKLQRNATPQDDACLACRYECTHRQRSARKHAKWHAKWHAPVVKTPKDVKPMAVTTFTAPYVPSSA